MNTTQAISRKTPGSGKKKTSGLQQVLTPDLVEGYAAQGMNFKEIALMYGCSKEWIGNVIGTKPELQAAWEAGNAKLCEIATAALMKKIQNGDTIAILFTLKARCGWVEQQYLINKPDVNLSPQVNVYLPENYRNQAPALEQVPDSRLTAN